VAGLGTGLFGRLDRQGSRPIATKFVHLHRMPLIPLGTYELLDEEMEISNPTIFSARSLLYSYLQSWGAVLAVAISVWAFVELLTGDGWFGLVLPLFAMTAMAAVIASWRIKTTAIAIGVPIALMAGAYGYGAMRRFPARPPNEAMVAPPEPKALAAEKAEQRIVERSVNLSGWQDKLFAIARAQYERKDWMKRACDDTAIERATEPRATELLLVEYNFIAKILDPMDERKSMRDWLVSEPLRDLAKIMIPDGTFEELASHRYLGVVTIRQDRKLKKKRSILAADLIVYDLATGSPMCGTPVKVVGLKRGLKKKFLARIEMKVGEISKSLRIEKPRIAGRS
jgi:hypothetical protein